MALVSALSKLGFAAVCPGRIASLLICILSMGNRSQKLSLYCAFKSRIPLSKATPPLYKILYSVLKACEFLDKKVSFLVEQAIKSTMTIKTE